MRCPVGEKVEKLWRNGHVEKMSFKPGVEERRDNGWLTMLMKEKNELAYMRSDESGKSS